MSAFDAAERESMLKQQRSLLLGASDMRQAAAAARALEHEEDVDLARALETAMMVCFMRPFTRSVALCKRVEDGFTHVAAGIRLVLDGHELPPAS